MNWIKKPLNGSVKFDSELKGALMSWCVLMCPFIWFMYWIFLRVARTYAEPVLFTCCFINLPLLHERASEVKCITDGFRFFFCVSPIRKICFPAGKVCVVAGKICVLARVVSCLCRVIFLSIVSHFTNIKLLLNKINYNDTFETSGSYLINNSTDFVLVSFRQKWLLKKLMVELIPSRSDSISRLLKVFPNFSVWNWKINDVFPCVARYKCSTN